GTSAQFTNQFAPLATVRGSVHPLSVRSEKRNVAFSPVRSTQLRTARSPSVDNCGCPLLGAAGEDTVVTLRGQSVSVDVTRGSPRIGAITSASVQSRTAATCLTGPPSGCVGIIAGPVHAVS